MPRRRTGRGRALERARQEPAGGRDVLHVEQHGARRRRVEREARVAACLPRRQVRERVHDAVVAEPEQRHRMHLEVQVRWSSPRVAGVADEAEHVAGPDPRALPGERRVGGQVSVVVLVPLPVAKPEPPATDGVPADREHRAVCDREHGCAAAGEQIRAVVPAGARPRRAEVVGERDRPVDREDVTRRPVMSGRTPGGGLRTIDGGSLRAPGGGRSRAGAASSSLPAAPARFVRRLHGRGGARRRLRVPDEQLRAGREAAVAPVSTTRAAATNAR